ncbi:fatty acid desaturase [Solirhodobacter olei]|uniref:fatty acid desaturase n=1 Tax=Solirhodobacter olei TaxID=2493082 RepID=UPI000FDB6A30|nr:fatty acid desaturase [Solirhodobacter olei]
MTTSTDRPSQQPEEGGKYWVRILARYREPSHLRSSWELVITLVPFAVLMGLAWWALSVSYLLAAVLSALNAGFLVRLFIIQHDCGHNAFFRNRRVNDWTGRALGVLTLTPYDVWRQTHSIHHASTGNLDRRGIGDVPTLTVREYRALPRLQRLGYRIYRNPLFLFGIAPAYLFFLQNRLPVGLMQSGRKYWVSAMATNAALAALLVAGFYFAQGLPFLLILLPMALIGASAGVWLFYVQHQFEDAYWNREGDWQIHDAALHGSSHYVLPPVLRWFTANIGIHHVHHLYSRIPFYRLTEVLREHPALARTQRLTLRQSLECARLHLWDEDRHKLLSFAELRAG